MDFTKENLMKYEKRTIIDMFIVMVNEKSEKLPEVKEVKDMSYKEVEEELRLSLRKPGPDALFEVDDSSDASVEEISPPRRYKKMTVIQKKNMKLFLRQKYQWANEAPPGIQPSPCSVRELNHHMNQWAKDRGIKLSGRNRGVPIYEQIARYVMDKHKARYPHKKWTVSDVTEEDKFCNGSRARPRVNLIPK